MKMFVLFKSAIKPPNTLKTFHFALVTARATSAKGDAYTTTSSYGWTSIRNLSAIFVDKL